MNGVQLKQTSPVTAFNYLTLVLDLLETTLAPWTNANLRAIIVRLCWCDAAFNARVVELKVWRLTGVDAAINST